MKRALRRLFNLAGAVSLVLCMALAAFWVRSYRLSDSVGYGGGGYGGAQLGSSGGNLSCAFYEVWPGKTGEVVWRSRPNWEGFAPQTLWNFHWGQVSGSHGPPVGIVFYFPHWVAILLTALGPLFWWRRSRLPQRRRRRGLCPACGYDLRGIAGACPECGAEPSEAPA